MASTYDREFLVPYLHDICAYHLAIRELDERIRVCNAKLHEYKAGWRAKPQEKIEYVKEPTGIISFFGFLLFLLMLYATYEFFAYPSGRGSAPGSFMFLVFVFGYSLGIFMMWKGYDSVKKAKEQNKLIKADYERYTKEYQKYVQEVDNQNKMARNQIPNLEQNLKFYVSEKNRVESLLAHAYSANVIAKQYRNIYVAVFLYDWFSTSGSNNLDNALGMFVLEEIKAKLDTIIRNQSNIIMNQRIMIAQQREA
ncbi:hypothetical protein, partial [Faecalicatena contorta]|uniref:hypothetical protein n=1 Tax=Faecalicatena contorta TaxID=39482 RepID=UPI001F469B06